MRKKGDRKLLIRAAASMVGMIIGAGIFAVPYAFLRSGTAAGIVLTAGVGVVFLVIHLLYGEVVLRTKEPHRLAGFAAMYLGPWGKRVVTVTSVLGFYGAILAYIVLGGAFLQAIVAPFLPITLFWSQIVFFVFVALVIFQGLRLAARLETALTALLALTILAILALIAPRSDVSNLAVVLADRELLLPYGVILFALGGASAVPEMRDMLIGKEKLLRPAVVWGTIVASALTLVFGLAVLSVTGEFTSAEAILGLAAAIGPAAIVLGAGMGLLAIATSFLIIGINLRELFELDYKMDRLSAWLLAVGVPFISFLLGAQSFIQIISVVGAVFVGIDAVVIGALYVVARERGRRRPEYRINVPFWAIFIIGLVFFLGMMAEIARLVS